MPDSFVQAVQTPSVADARSEAARTRGRAGDHGP